MVKSVELDKTKTIKDYNMSMLSHKLGLAVELGAGPDLSSGSGSGSGATPSGEGSPLSVTRNGGIHNLTANTVFRTGREGTAGYRENNGVLGPSDPLFDRSNISDAVYIDMLIYENQELRLLLKKYQRQIQMLNTRIELMTKEQESSSNELAARLANRTLVPEQEKEQETPQDQTNPLQPSRSTNAILDDIPPPIIKPIEPVVSRDVLIAKTVDLTPEPQIDDIPQRSERRNPLNKALPLAPSTTSISSVVSHAHTIDSSSILSEGIKSNLASDSSDMLSSPVDTTQGSLALERKLSGTPVPTGTVVGNATPVKMAAVYQNKQNQNNSASSIGSGSGSGSGSTYKSRLKLPATLQNSNAKQPSKRDERPLPLQQPLESSILTLNSQNQSNYAPSIPQLLHSSNTPQQQSRTSIKRSSSTYIDSLGEVTPQTPLHQEKYFHDSPPSVTPYLNTFANEKPIFRSPERSASDVYPGHLEHVELGSKYNLFSRRRRGNLATETIHSGIGSTHELPRSPNKVHTPATQIILVFQSLSDRRSVPHSPESLAVSNKQFKIDDLHGADIHNFISSPLPNSFQHNLTSPQRSMLTDAESYKGNSGSDIYSKNNRSQTLGSFSVLSTPKEEDYSKLFIKPEDFMTILISVISTLSLGKNEEPCCILGAVDKSTSKEMWKVKKSYNQLVELDHEIRPLLDCFGLPLLPDKSSFFSNVPTKVDSRRITIQDYFNSIYVMPHVPHLVLYAVCLFLSLDIVNPLDEFRSGSAKEGYLIRKYKGFGSSWKVRWCQVDGPMLEVYDAPGGSLVELLQLQGVSIGRQSNDSVADERGYRHAFLIMENTKSTKLSSSKHFFCAESDFDRDEWITMLLEYTQGDSSSELGGSSSALQTPTSKYDGPDDLDYTLSKTKTRGTSTPTSAYDEGDSSLMVPEDPKESLGRKASSSKIRSLFPFSKTSRNHTNDSGLSSTDDTVVQSDAALVPVSNNSHEIDYYLKQMQLDDQLAKAIFGREIDYGYNLSHGSFYDRSIPSVLSRCLVFMTRTGAIYEEGIFRLSGSASTIRQLKDKFNKEYDIDLFQCSLKPDIHTVAGLFKTYLRELPSPIFGLKAYSKLNAIAHSGKSDREVAYAFSRYLNTSSDIEKLNYDVSYVIFRFLREVIAQSRNNKMNARNMCIVFVPTLNISVEVLIPFLVDFECIYEGADPIPDQQREVLDVSIPQF